jgi:hypothetical protein
MEVAPDPLVFKRQLAGKRTLKSYTPATENDVTDAPEFVAGGKILPEADN